jgi:hypothetical protein
MSRTSRHAPGTALRTACSEPSTTLLVASLGYTHMFRVVALVAITVAAVSYALSRTLATAR